MEVKQTASEPDYNSNERARQWTRFGKVTCKIASQRNKNCQFYLYPKAGQFQPDYFVSHLNRFCKVYCKFFYQEFARLKRAWSYDCLPHGGAPLPTSDLSLCFTLIHLYRAVARSWSLPPAWVGVGSLPQLSLLLEAPRFFSYLDCGASSFPIL